MLVVVSVCVCSEFSLITKVKKVLHEKLHVFVIVNNYYVQRAFSIYTKVVWYYLYKTYMHHIKSHLLHGNNYIHTHAHTK